MKKSWRHRSTLNGLLHLVEEMQIKAMIYCSKKLVAGVKTFTPRQKVKLP